MSSGFVSGGTNDAPIERDDAWATAQRELEEERRRKEEAKEQNGGKSLFEILEANKAAKQEAFEEANKFKNQFRALDDEEVEFLDAVLESERAKEAAIRKETREQLDSFRKLQEEAEKAALLGADTDGPVAEEEQLFATARKRKKGKEKEPLRGVKLRKSSSTAEQPEPDRKIAGKPQEKKMVSQEEDEKKPQESNKKPQEENRKPLEEKKKPPMLGLGNYSSDEDD